MYKLLWVVGVCAGLVGCTEEPQLTFEPPVVVDETRPDGVYEIGERIWLELALEAHEDYDELVGVWMRSRSYHGEGRHTDEYVDGMAAGDVEWMTFSVDLVHEDAVYPDEVVELQFDVHAPSCLFRDDCPVPFSQRVVLPVQLPE